jgi:aspartyl protease family protein
MTGRTRVGGAVLGLLLCAVAAVAAPTAGGTAAVALAGTMGDKVVLIVDGQTRVITVGARVDGMLVQRAGDRSVVIESGGVRQQLTLGSTPVMVGGGAPGSGAGQRLVLQAGGDRLFHAEGRINDQPVSGVVDTGATVMVVSLSVARRLGVDVQGGQGTEVQTAAGRSNGRRVRLPRVSLGPLLAHDVEAVVIDTELPYVLYGNSFLQGFKVQSEQGRMTLTP